MMNQLDQLFVIKNKVTRFMLVYKFALDELQTKVNILKEEFVMIHDYNPIEHTKTRLKTPESIANKLYRKGGGGSLASIKERIRDIAGMRITCSFTEDIYWISDMLQNQSDLRIVEVKDYIKNPKPNGYRSLHLLVEVPVFMSDRTELVYVEVQIRTIAMDFWASLEHKIFYKYEGAVPQQLLDELKDAADSAAMLDRKMERIQHEIEKVKSSQPAQPDAVRGMLVAAQQNLQIPHALLELVQEGD